jgi:hypothetical protein
MTMATLLAVVQNLEGVSFHEGADALALDQFLAEQRLYLPSQHKEILTWSNGLEVYGGYFRLLGINSITELDSALWNQDNYWKFAWGDRCSAYWCFGETAWGDQYAYSTDSLRGTGECAVYLLDAMSMTPQKISSSFADFFEREFVRSAHTPYDEMISLARDKFGPLDIGLHLAYVPSLLLGGTEIIENVTTMNARSAMISNGDIATQLDAGPDEGQVKMLQPYQDTQGRTRLRLVWK